MPLQLKRLAALRELSRVLDDHGITGDPEATGDVAALRVHPCEVFRQIRGPLSLVLPLLAFVPVYGPPIVAAVKLLIGLADRACPAAPFLETPRRG